MSCFLRISPDQWLEALAGSLSSSLDTHGGLTCATEAGNLDGVSKNFTLLRDLLNSTGS